LWQPLSKALGISSDPIKYASAPATCAWIVQAHISQSHGFRCIRQMPWHQSLIKFMTFCSKCFLHAMQKWHHCHRHIDNDCQRTPCPVGHKHASGDDSPCSKLCHRSINVHLLRWLSLHARLACADPGVLYKRHIERHAGDTPAHSVQSPAIRDNQESSVPEWPLLCSRSGSWTTHSGHNCQRQ